MNTFTPKPKLAPVVTPVSYSVGDAARALGIGKSFTFRLIREGKIKAVKIGGRTVVPVAECEAFIARAGGAGGHLQSAVPCSRRSADD